MVYPKTFRYPTTKDTVFRGSVRGALARGVSRVQSIRQKNEHRGSIPQRNCPKCCASESRVRSVSGNSVDGHIVEDLEASVRSMDDDHVPVALQPEHRNDTWDSGTQSVHGGERGGRPRVSDSLTTPVVMTSTFTFRNTAELIAYQEGRYGSYEYGRYGNPTSRAVEEKLKVLEGAEAALISASGMCAATTVMLALVPAGGHIVTTTDCYRRTRQFIQTILPKMQITSTVIDPSDLDTLESVLQERQVSLFFTESPTNPYLRCVDVERVAQLCHKTSTIVVIDSTFATSINQKALSFGADLVLHSATKYLAGHNDVLAGAIAGKEELVESVRSLHNVLGGVIDPHASYLVLRGMKTLRLRVEQHNRNAMRLAQKLEQHPAVRRVYYPGLPSHPDHNIARQQMNGYGGVVSYEIDGDLWRTAKYIDSVRLPYIAPSLGGVESLIEQPAVISYWDIGPEGRSAVGIKDSLIRFSCGIEDFEDIWEDTKQALDSL